MPDTRQPSPVLSRLGGLLEGALNRGLALDEPTRERMSALEGRRVGIELRGLNLALALRVENGQLRVGPHWEQAGDLNVRASPASLLAFGLRGDSPLPAGRVEISGDAELARRLEKLLREFRPDVEEAFAGAFGDVLGVPLARALQSALRWTRESAHALAKDTAEYLREDSRDVPASGEVEEFLDDVDALRERVDRIDARVQGMARSRRGDAT
jgi:ubiquinone biosynthesis accessory factor UbiJ